MKPLYLCITADDAALHNYSSYEHLEQLIDLWDELGVKGTLFTVPRSEGRQIGQDKTYVRILKDAAKRGHEIAQHGLDHTRFETGIPPAMVLNLAHEGPTREYLATHRKEIDDSHTIENLRKMLTTGREILQSALDLPIHGFRAPCVSTCENLFKALAMENYAYDSSHAMQESAWKLIVDPEHPVPPLPITKKTFDNAQKVPNLLTLPISAEYTWYLKKEHYTAFLDLAKHDFDACLKAQIPYIPVSHVSPIFQGDPDCGATLYRDLLTHARQQAAQHNRTLICTTMHDTAKILKL